MDGDTTERLSQESQCPDAKEHGLLARASAFAGGVLSSIQALAGTTACKGVQIARLKDWAKENDCWIENPESLGVFSDRGSENEVYMAILNSTFLLISTLLRTTFCAFSKETGIFAAP